MGRPTIIFETGTRFGKLTVVGFAGVVARLKQKPEGFHTVVCECGSVKNVRTTSLRQGLSRSCGSARCKVSYKGGCSNKHSLAWANSRISSVNYHSKKRGYALLNATAEELLFMFAHKKGRCHACDRTRDSLCIDHCHDTGLLRGILCRQCNAAVGMCGESERVWNGIKRYMNRVVLQRPLPGVCVGHGG